MRNLLLRIALAALAFAGISLWTFWTVIHPRKMHAGIEPHSYGLEARELTIETPDHLRLSAWLIASNQASGERTIIVLLHGYPAEKSDLLDIAASLHPNFDLLLLDLRYFGKSEGTYTTLGLQERRDLVPVLDFLEAQGYRRIGILGVSLGGAVAMLAAAEDRRVGAVASYGAFADLKTLGEETYRRLWVLQKPLVGLMLVWARLIFRESAGAITPENAAKTLTIPTLIIHSRHDDMVPFRHALKLQTALARNQKAEFYFPQQGVHGALPPDFSDRIGNFFEKALGRNPS